MFLVGSFCQVSGPFSVAGQSIVGPEFSRLYPSPPSRVHVGLAGHVETGLASSSEVLEE